MNGMVAVLSNQHGTVNENVITPRGEDVISQGDQGATASANMRQINFIKYIKGID